MAERDRLADDLRLADPDRYLSVLYAPEDKRADLVAVYAFNAEIAGIRDRIHEALPGEIRIQWWRDVLAAEDAASGHPVADRLVAAIRRHSLPPAAFKNYLDARIFDLYDDPMPSRTDLEGYLGETAGFLIQVAAMILDPQAAPAFAELAGHAGCSQGIAGLLRLLPLHRARGQCFVPRDILAAAGTAPEEFLGEGAHAASGRAVAAMVALAREHFQAFAGRAGPLPESLRPAFLPMAVVPGYLAAVSKKGTAVLTEPVDVPGWKRQWRIFRAASAGW
jgi:phytoene synthase